MTPAQRSFVARARYYGRLIDVSHDFCPRCYSSEAFHPECCPITPEEWREDAAAAVSWAIQRHCTCCPMDVTREQLEHRHGTPSRFAADVYNCRPPDHPEAKRVIAAYWYEWRAARASY